MAPISLNDFKNQGQAAAYWKTRCQDSIKAAAGKSDAVFVAVKNYQMDRAFVSLFFVVENASLAEAIKNHLKTLKQTTPMVVSSGTADVMQPEKGKFKVLVKKAVGGLSANIISSSVVAPAVGKDAKFAATTPEREQAEVDSQKPSVARPPAVVAKESLNQALKDAAAPALRAKMIPTS